MSRLRGLLPLSQRGGRYGETYKYARLDEEDGYSGRVQQSHSKKSKQQQNSLVNSKAFALLIMVLLLATAAGLLVSGYYSMATWSQMFADTSIRSFAQSKSNAGCDSVQKGYQCRPEISHYWYDI